MRKNAQILVAIRRCLRVTPSPEYELDIVLER